MRTGHFGGRPAVSPVLVLEKKFPVAVTMSNPVIIFYSSVFLPRSQTTFSKIPPDFPFLNKPISLRLILTYALCSELKEEERCLFSCSFFLCCRKVSVMASVMEPGIKLTIISETWAKSWPAKRQKTIFYPYHNYE